MLKNLLESCGLNKNEQLIFIHLAKNGTSIASAIAKRTKLKRPTVYAILDNLIRLGIVTKHKKGSVNSFSTIPIHLIAKTIENNAKLKFLEIQNASKLLTSHLEDIKKKSHAGIGDFEVVTVESVQALYSQLDATLKSGDFQGIFNPQEIFFNKEQRDIAYNFLKETAVLKPLIKEIAVAGPMTDWYKSKIKNPNHQLKEISADKKILSDMIFIDNQVFIFNYEPKQQSGIKIQQSQFYSSMKTIFEMLWESI